MGYRRKRYRKNFIGPRPKRKTRRRRKRRRGSNKQRQWKDFLADNRRTMGVQKTFTETRNGNVSMEMPVNLVNIQAIICMGCPNEDQGIIAQALGQTSTALGVQHVGDQDQKDDNSRDLSKHYIYGERKNVHIRNVSLHPVWVCVYECVAKRDITSDESNYQDPRDIVMHDFCVGIKDQMADGVATTTLYSGDGMIAYTPGSTLGTTRSKYLKPTQSARFNQNWKVAVYKKYRMTPGDDVYWKMSTKNHIHNPELDTSNNGNGLLQARTVRKRLTKVLLIMAHGVIGAITTDANKIGFLASHLAIDLTASAKCMPIRFGEANNSASVVVDTDTDLALIVGPSDYEDKSDE